MSVTQHHARTLRQQQARIGLLLILPSLVIILGIVLQPVISTAFFSLFDAKVAPNAPRNSSGCRTTPNC
ncbi:MAG: hypothetical protein IPK16_32290 [Anaerolineales bacterium]|nr:hypothetical protein [Anaerolineales bacterium]